MLISGPVVKRLRHCPFTAVTWVRTPSGSPHTDYQIVKHRRQLRCFISALAQNSGTMCPGSKTARYAGEIKA